MPIQFRQCTLTRTETSKEKQTKINQISAPNGSTETIQIYSLITNYLLAESTMISPNQHMVLAREQVLQLFVPFTSVVHYCCRYHFSQTHIHTFQICTYHLRAPDRMSRSDTVLRIYISLGCNPSAQMPNERLELSPWTEPSDRLASTLYQQQWFRILMASRWESAHETGGSWSHSGQNREPTSRLFIITAQFSPESSSAHEQHPTVINKEPNAAAHVLSIWQTVSLVLSPCTFQW